MSCSTIRGKEITVFGKSEASSAFQKKKSGALTFESGKDYEILMIAGPYAGGKASCSKNPWVFNFNGSFKIPIPITLNIREIGFLRSLADIGDEQYETVSLFFFSSCDEITKILREVHRNCLCMDELSSRNGSTKGSARISIIDYFKEKIAMPLFYS